jgi:hypothetical protein
MAVGALFEAKGVTQAQYEQVRNEVIPGGQLPTGLLYHVAGPMEDGWRVIEVWESQEAIQRVFEERLGAALQRAGISVEPKFFPITTLLHP